MAPNQLDPASQHPCPIGSTTNIYSVWTLFLKARHIKLAPVRDPTNTTLQHYFDLSLDCNLDLALAWPISLFEKSG